jgi:hypothetical protein
LAPDGSPEQRASSLALQEPMLEQDQSWLLPAKLSEKNHPEMKGPAGKGAFQFGQWLLAKKKSIFSLVALSGSAWDVWTSHGKALKIIERICNFECRCDRYCH